MSIVFFSLNLIVLVVELELKELVVETAFGEEGF
jgi:hypothetical protein